VTRVSVDITHKSNYIQCAVCEMAHPPYTRFCPAAGNP
jgi:ribosomal protein L31